MSAHIRVILIRVRNRYMFHVESYGQIRTVSKRYWFLSNARRNAKDVAKKLKAGFVDYV